MSKKIFSIETESKLLFYSRELLKIKLSYKRRAYSSDSFENQKLHKLYRQLKKTIAQLSSTSPISPN